MDEAKQQLSNSKKPNERAMRSTFNDNTSTYNALIETANMPTLHNRRVQDMCILTYKASLS